MEALPLLAPHLGADAAVAFGQHLVLLLRQQPQRLRLRRARAADERVPARVRGCACSLRGGLRVRVSAPAPGGPVRGCTLTFEVADVDALYAKALANGGAEAMPPTDFPGIGRCGYCEDGEGNIFGMITSAQGDDT